MPRHSDDSAFEDGQLVELVKTKLRIDNGELQRLNAEGRLLLHLPLEDVEHIEVRRKLDMPIFVVLNILAVGAGVIGWFFSENNILSVILYIVTLILVCFAIIGSIATQIVVHTLDGKVPINCTDDMDEAECFVATVKQLLRNRKSRGDGPRDSSTAFRS